MAYGLLLLRLVVGGTMFAHGAQKLFGWFGGGGPEGTAGMFGSLGFRSPRAMAVIAGACEAAGLLFLLGLLTPLAALAIAVVMLVAIATVHWQNGFFATKGGYEFNLTLLAVVVAITATGPGRFSFDRLLGLDEYSAGLWWGLGVLVIAILSAAATVGLFREQPPVAMDEAAADEPLAREPAPAARDRERTTAR
jgi:putative oxidoreductase